MRVQAARIPQGHVLVVMNGKLVAVPRAGNTMQYSAHVAGVATGEVANAVATPFMLAYDIGKSLVDAVAGSQYGQSTKYGWDKAQMRKATWAQARHLKKVNPQDMRVMLIDTVTGPQKGNWAILVSRMTDDEVRRELANRSVPNPYLDEALTYGGVTEAFEVPEVVDVEPAQVPQVTRAPQQVHEGTADRSLMVGAFSA
jgi:hypothetical protein